MKRVRGVSKTENNQGVPGGPPLNQYKRYLPLKKGEHTLIMALEPLADEPRDHLGNRDRCSKQDPHRNFPVNHAEGDHFAPPI